MYLALIKNMRYKKNKILIIHLLRIKCFALLFIILNSGAFAQNKTVNGSTNLVLDYFELNQNKVYGK